MLGLLLAERSESADTNNSFTSVTPYIIAGGGTIIIITILIILVVIVRKRTLR